MRLLTLLKTLNEGMLDMSLEMAVPVATEMLYKQMMDGNESGGRNVALEIFHAGVYNDPYYDPETEELDSYQEYYQKQKQWITRWSKARVENAAQEIIEGMSYNRHEGMDGIVVYRVIMAPEDFPSKIKSRGLGEYWSWDEHAAEAHWAGDGDHEFMIVGLVDPRHVNWEQTLFQNAHPSYDHEKELYIPEGSPIELYKLLKGNGDEVDPQVYGGRQMLQASVGMTEELYHATTHDVDEFNPLSHFGTADAAAERADSRNDIRGMRTYRAQLDIKNPVLMWDRGSGHKSVDDIADGISYYIHKNGTGSAGNVSMEELDAMTAKWHEALHAEYERRDGPLDRETRWGMEADNRDELIAFLKSRGHDGIAYKNEVEDRGAMSYINFDRVKAESKVANGARFARLSELRNEDDAARLARGQAMGFDTSKVWYHGTNRSFDGFAKDVDPVFDNAQQYLGHFFTSNPKYAGGYARGDDPQMTSYGGGNIIPVFLRAKKLKAESIDVINAIEGGEFGGWELEEVEYYKSELIQQGYDGIRFDEGGHDEVVVFDASQVRSIHAQFDDENSTNLLASIGESAGGQYVYHAATARDFGSIMQKGLTFFNPSRWTKAASPNERYQDEPSVFAFEHPHDAWRWAAKMEWEFKEPAVVVKFKRGDSWGKDPSEDIAIQMGKGKALQSHEPIPASDIVGAKTVEQIGTPVSTGLHGEEFDQHVIDTLEGR